MKSGALARPVITSVADRASGLADCCTPGDLFVVKGRGFGRWKDVPQDMGVYVHCTHELHLHRIDEYELWDDEEIRARWPRWLVGSFRLFVETRANCDTIVSAVHSAPVQIAAPR